MGFMCEEGLIDLGSSGSPLKKKKKLKIWVLEFEFFFGDNSIAGGMRIWTMELGGANWATALMPLAWNLKGSF